MLYLNSSRNFKFRRPQDIENWPRNGKVSSFQSCCFSWVRYRNWFRTEKTIIPLIIVFLEGVGWKKLISSTALHILHSTERKWPLGTNYQPRIDIWATVDQPMSKMLFESMRKCRIRIPLEILSFVDPKILKIGLEMAKLAYLTVARRLPGEV